MDKRRKKDARVVKENPEIGGKLSLNKTKVATGHEPCDQGHITALFFPKGFKARVHWEGMDWRNDSVVNVPAFALV